MITLQAIVLAAALSGPGDTVLLDFSAQWCGPCRMMEPTIGRLRDAGYPVRQVDVDRQPELARQFSVRPIPCFVLLVDGKEVQRIVGPASFDRMAQMFQQAGVSPRQPTGMAVRGQSPDAIPTLGSMTAPSMESFASSRGPAATVPATVPFANPVTSPAIPSSQPAPGVPDYSPNLATVQQQAMQATVRLKVVDPTGQSYGTGTIIDTHGDEALIVTCGHIFRESKGRGQILVDLFLPGVQGPVVGQLVAYEADERDIGLVSIRPGVAVTPIRVASTNFRPQVGDTVFSIGCDHGDQPTERTSRISAVDRYTGPPNLEVYGHPAEGRSGGGLFTADGQLIGICNAADWQDDRGIYASLPTIHTKLKQIGLERVYRRQEAAVASTSSPSPPAAVGINGSQHLEPLPMMPVASSARGSAPATMAGSDMEVICVIRSRSNPASQSQVVILDHPPQEVLQQLARQANQPSGRGDRVADLARLPAIGAPSAPAGQVNPPILRAQNR